MMFLNAALEAKVLVESFTLYLGTDAEGNECFVETLDAKRCAIIAVDKILDFIQYNIQPYTYDEDSMSNVKYNIKYYNCVKEEIEKL